MKKPSATQSSRAGRTSRRRSQVSSPLAQSASPIDEIISPAEPASPIIEDQPKTFVSTKRTFAKSSVEMAANLPPEDRVPIEPYAILTAHLMGRTGVHFEIGNAVLDGEPLPVSMRFIAAGHWQLK